jgi:hypothetical protein
MGGDFDVIPTKYYLLQDHEAFLFLIVSAVFVEKVMPSPLKCL